LFCLGFVGVACPNNCLTAHFVTRTWPLLWQDMTHNCGTQNTTPKGLGWVELSWVGLGWVGLGWSMGVSYYNMNIVVVLSRVKYLHHSHVWMMMMMICMLWVLLCFTSSSTSNSRAVFIEGIELMNWWRSLSAFGRALGHRCHFAHMTFCNGTTTNKCTPIESFVKLKLTRGVCQSVTLWPCHLH
jgi:hypothetical protein